MSSANAPRRAPVDWAAIRQLYEAGEMTLAAIAEQHRVTTSALYRKRQAEDWLPRSSSGKVRNTRKPNKRSRRTRQEPLLERLFKVVDRNLRLMERRMDSDEPGTAADRERDTRTIGTLTRTIGKITELQAETDVAGDTAGRRRSRDINDNRDTDALRLEIAERILKLREHRNAR